MNDVLSIAETDQGRAFWLDQGLARQSLQLVSAADVLIVPVKDFRDGVRFVFHQDTATFSRWLAEHLDGQATIEVLADDDEYMEVALHGAAHRFSTIIVSYVLAPFVINLLSTYLYDVLKTNPGDGLELKIVIEDHECRAMQVNFKGEAKDFAQIADKVGQISRDCISAAHPKHQPQAAGHHARLQSESTTGAPPTISHSTRSGTGNGT